MARSYRASQIRFTAAARKAKAYRTLGVSEEQIADAPPITTLLRNKRRSLKRVLFALLLSQDPVVHKFLAKRDTLGEWERQNVCWEAIAIAAGIDVEQFLGAAILAMREYGKIIVMDYLPEVLEKQIEFAKLPGGWRDRDALYKLVGVL